MTSTTTHSDVLAHVAGVPVEEALLAAPALLAGVTAIVGYWPGGAGRVRQSLDPAICSYLVCRGSVRPAVGFPWAMERMPCPLAPP
ncbi:MAG TPA: hypothetical protein VEX12_06800 [Microbacterium sp.]|nr:hypothetical protein [Microbacterium sp.]